MPDSSPILIFCTPWQSRFGHWNTRIKSQQLSVAISMKEIVIFVALIGAMIHWQLAFASYVEEPDPSENVPLTDENILHVDLHPMQERSLPTCHSMRMYHTYSLSKFTIFHIHTRCSTYVYILVICCSTYVYILVHMSHIINKHMHTYFMLYYSSSTAQALAVFGFPLVITTGTYDYQRWRRWRRRWRGGWCSCGALTRKEGKHTSPETGERVGVTLTHRSQSDAFT